MKIAHLPANFFPSVGGTQVVVHNVAEHQQALGHQVFLITRATRNKKAYKELKNNLPYILLPLMSRTIPLIKKFKKFNIDVSWLLGLQLQYYQRKYKFDVWHVSQMGPTVLYALPFLKKMNVPIIGTCHGIDIQKLPSINYGWRLQKSYEEKLKDALADCDLITAISDTVSNDYKSLQIPDEKVIDVPNGINFEYIHNFASDPGELKKALNLPADKKIIITVGRNHPKKGYRYIPEIVKYVAQERTDILWLVVGNGTETVAEEAKKLGVENFVKTMPVIGLKKRNNDKLYMFPSGDLINLYKSADVFAFPTLIESFGLVNIEAMAAGLPVIVTDAPGCSDLVKHEYNGLVSPVGDSKAMAQNILRVLESSELRSTLVKNGIAEAKKYDWRKVANQYINTYKEGIQYKKHGKIPVKEEELEFN